MRTTFSTALLLALVAGSGNAIDLGRRQGQPLSSASTTTSSTAALTTSSSPGPAQSLSFVTPTEVTTCQDTLIQWVYAGSGGELLTLGISNANVTQTGIDPAPPLTFLPLADDLDPGTYNWTWSPVNLTMGYYFLLGGAGTIDAQSDIFLITNGSDTSCLVAPTPTSVSSSASVTGTSSSSTSSQSVTSWPTPAPMSTAKKSNAGAIAGGVVGGILVLLIIGAIIMMLMRRKNRSARARRSFSDPHDPFTRGKSASATRHHGPSESTGGMLSDIGPAIATAVDAHSNENLYSADEKGGSPGKASSIDAIAQLAYTGGAHHRSSSSSSLNQPPTARTSLSHSRASPTNGRRPSLDAADYLRSERLASNPGAQRSIPPRTAAGIESIPMGRSSSGQSRRASRKPVPQYDASELQVTASEVSLPMPSPQDPGSGLRHQSSSGDIRPVHYLMPDLPPPGQY